jgi:glutamyl-tRNA reductase
VSGAPGIRVIGLSHHTTPLDVRERVTVPVPEAGPLLRDWIARDGWLEAVVVSTCNRTELVAVTDGTGTGGDAFLDHLARKAGMPVERYLYRFESEAAVEHVFRVSASLDSLVLGEAQILGQINDAVDAAAAAGVLGPVLDRLFARARQAAKRVRNETGIGEMHVSVASVAVELAEKIFGRLAGRSAMVVGAGEIAELTLTHLAGAGIRRVTVANRTGERAVRLADRMGVVPVDFERRYEALADIDVVLSATAAEEPVFTRAGLAGVMSRRRHRPIFLVDLAVPRDVEPAAASLDDLFLYNIDDLGEVVERNRSDRRVEADKGKAIVADEAGRFLDWLATRQTVPTVVALRERLESIGAAEEARLLERLGHLPDKDRQAVSAFAAGLIGKILHEPTVRLRESRHPRETARLIEAARVLFALDEANRSDAANGSQPQGRRPNGGEDRRGDGADG